MMAKLWMDLTSLGRYGSKVGDSCPALPPRLLFPVSLPQSRHAPPLFRRPPCSTGSLPGAGALAAFLWWPAGTEGSTRTTATTMATPTPSTQSPLVRAPERWAAPGLHVREERRCQAFARCLGGGCSTSGCFKTLACVGNSLQIEKSCSQERFGQEPSSR